MPTHSILARAVSRRGHRWGRGSSFSYNRIDSRGPIVKHETSGQAARRQVIPAIQDSNLAKSGRFSEGGSGEGAGYGLFSADMGGVDSTLTGSRSRPGVYSAERRTRSWPIAHGPVRLEKSFPRARTGMSGGGLRRTGWCRHRHGVVESLHKGRSIQYEQQGK
jgi:hypothetical protein